MVIGIVSWFTVPDFPENSNLLKSDDKELYTLRLQRDRGEANVDEITLLTLKKVLSDWTSWFQFLLFTFTDTSTYSLAFFVPTILTVYLPLPLIPSSQFLTIIRREWATADLKQVCTRRGPTWPLW